MGLEAVSVPHGLLIIAFAAFVTGIILRRLCIIQVAAMSALIESDGRLYYLTVTPNLRGSTVPKSVSALLAGADATYAENSVDAQIAASNYARNDATVLQFFRLFQEDKIKTTFDTVMYGKPVVVYELLDRNFKNENRQIYRVKCIKNKKRHTVVRIPRAFPTFFE